MLTWAEVDCSIHPSDQADVGSCLNGSVCENEAQNPWVSEHDRTTGAPSCVPVVRLCVSRFFIFIYWALALSLFLSFYLSILHPVA